ncbi:MAG: VOC family protein, partial [Planctomycetes bacterium]|nr:VOC family protein [Planctomycetota bacterium]
SSTARIYHFGFTIADMPSFVRRLEAAGIPIQERADRKEGPAVYLSDPDGHEIEVVAYKAEYAYR